MSDEAAAEEAVSEQVASEENFETAAQTTTEETAPNGEDTSTDDWREAIADTKLRDHAGKFTSVLDLVGKHYELRKQLSTAINPLGKEPTEDQVSSYRKATGVPETAEGYEFSVPEGHEGDPAFQNAAAAIFHQLNVPAETGRGLSEWFNHLALEAQQSELNDDKAYADESLAALKAEWPGAEFDRNKHHADLAATKVFGADLEDVKQIETKDGRFVLDNPAFIKMLAGIGREMSEGRLGTVMTEGAEAAIDTEIDGLEAQMDKATAAGDNVKANELYIKQQELYRKKVGSVPVVGAQSRVA